MFLFTNLSEGGNGNPSKVQDIVGVGDPPAMHLREAVGPGVKVCCINRYRNSGGEAGENSKKTND